MSFTSPSLSLPFIAPAQAQKHVTHNEALRALDAVVQMSLKSRALTAPPATPAEGDRYYIAAVASADWLSKEGQIAVWQDAAWAYLAPQIGWRSWIEDEAIFLIWDGSNWQSLNTFQNLEYLGVQATADATNRLSVNSPAVLFNNAGSDVRTKLNKNIMEDTASVLLQTGFSGRAEIGLVGDDDLSVKVSSDGSNFTTAMKIDSVDGSVHTNDLKHIHTGTSLSSLMLTLGGDGVTSIYNINQTSGPAGRSAVIGSLSSDVITLTSVDVGLFGDVSMNGVSYVRIWNIDKTPMQSAWVKTRPSNNQIQVTDAVHISTWSANETLQIGDPLGMGLSVNSILIAVDISPMLITQFGQAFRQKGLVVAGSMSGGAAGDEISVAPQDIAGGFVTVAQTNVHSGTSIIGCSVLSDISNSNLLGIKEVINITTDTRTLHTVAVLA